MPGETVFLGEEGLDITATGVMSGDQIGWWAPGSSRTAEPNELVTISSAESFYVSPSLFAGKEGLWYKWPEGTLVFHVKKPQIAIRVYDETADFDATGKWIPRGDIVSFRISSNVYEAQSRGESDGQADITLISPDGAKYSSVSGPSGTFRLTQIPLTSSLTSTGPVWSTGGVPTGRWTVQAEISMNRIKDNLPEIGTGISAPVEILIQNVNPLIKGQGAVEIETNSSEMSPSVTNTPLPVRTQPPTVSPARISTQNIQNMATEAKTTEHISPLPTALSAPEKAAPSLPTATQTPLPTRSPIGIGGVIGSLVILLFINRD